MTKRRRLLITAAAVLTVGVASTVTGVHANAATSPTAAAHLAAPVTPVGPGAPTSIRFDGDAGAANVMCEVWIYPPWLNEDFKIASQVAISCGQPTKVLSVRISIYSGFLEVRDSVRGDPSKPDGFGPVSGAWGLQIPSRPAPCYDGAYMTNAVAHVEHFDGTVKDTEFWSDFSTIICPNA